MRQPRGETDIGDSKGMCTFTMCVRARTREASDIAHKISAKWDKGMQTFLEPTSFCNCLSKVFLPNAWGFSCLLCLLWLIKKDYFIATSKVKTANKISLDNKQYNIHRREQTPLGGTSERQKKHLQTKMKQIHT